MSPSSKTPSRAPVRGGIRVNVVHRSGGFASSSASGSATGAASSSSPNGRSRRPSKPSARYRKVLARPKVSHGGDFVKDDEAGRQFENRVLEVYAPAETVNETQRRIPLGRQAWRDGDAFHLPKLSTMCLNVISKHFETHILPHQYAATQGIDGTAKAAKANRSRGLLNFGLVGYDEDRDDDFVPENDGGKGGSSPSKRQKISRQTASRATTSQANARIQERKNIDYLELLPAKLTYALQELLERKAPRMLTYDVLAKYFLNRQKTSSAGMFRILAIVGGVPTDDAVRLWKRLVMRIETPSGPGKVFRPNAANKLRTLHLQAFTRLTSSHLTPFLAELLNLECICLRGCVNVTSEAVEVLVNACGATLRKANFNWTSIGVTGVEHLVRGAPNLEELKIAHVQGLNDVSVPQLINRATQATIEQGTVPLGKLRKLKVNGTHVSSAGVGSFLKHCGPQLRSLDIGDTRVGGSGCIDILLMALGYRLGQDPSNYANRNQTLQKINLSRLEISEMDLYHFIRAIPDFVALRTINLNHIQPLQGGSSSGLSANLLAYLFHNISLRALDTGGKQGGSGASYLFEKISLASTSISTRPLMPGIFSVPMSTPIHNRISPRVVRSLDLSGLDLSAQDRLDDQVSVKLPDGTSFERIPSLCEPDDDTSSLWTSLDAEEVFLAGCKMPAQCHWPRVGIAGRARKVDLSGTSVERGMIDKLIEDNPFVEAMDLTGCRSIPVRHRRNYFDVWEEERGDDT